LDHSAGENVEEEPLVPTAANQPRFPKRPDFVGRYVRLTYINMMEEIDAGTADSYPDVTPAMKQVLLFVGRDGSRLTELAELARMTKQSMGEHVDGLVELGLLERIPDPNDGRAKLIRPTADGLMCMNYALGVAVGVHEHWESLLGQRKTEQLMTLLRELNNKLEAEKATARAQLGDDRDGASKRVS
jgi:DNA-binding MarR family transcriptional regulator